MNKQEFIDLGLSEELAQKAAEVSQKELKGYVPRDRFEEADQAKKKAEDALKEQTEKLDTLKESSGDNEELKEKIQKLQADAIEKEKQHQEEMRELKMGNAIRSALSGKVHDEELVASLFDKSKLILGEDGKVTGLEEQLKSLQESKGFLFKQDEKENKPGFHKVGGNPPSNPESSGAINLHDAIASKYGV